MSEQDRKITELEYRLKSFTQQNAELQARNRELEKTITDIFNTALRIAK